MKLNNFDNHDGFTDYFSEEMNTFSDKSTMYAELASINAQLHKLALPQLGDLFSSSPETVHNTLSIVSELLQRAFKSHESRANYSSKLSKMNVETKSLHQRLEKLNHKKKLLEDEKESKRDKIKQLENKILSQRQIINREREKMEKEKTAFQNKEKQFLNALKKKQGMIKGLQDKLDRFGDARNSMNFGSARSSPKDSIVINDAEKISAVMKSGPTIYSEASGDFMKLLSDKQISLFDKLKKENGVLRSALKELQGMMFDIVEFRKLQFGAGASSEYSDYEDSVDQAGELKELKGELFNTQGTPMTAHTLMEVRDNVKKFKTFLDKTKAITSQEAQEFGEDLARLSTNVVDATDFKNFGHFTNLLKNYKYVLTTQDNLLKKSIDKSQKSLELDYDEIKENLCQSEMNLEGFKKKLSKSVMEASISSLDNGGFSGIEDLKKMLKDSFVRIEKEKKTLEVRRDVSFRLRANRYFIYSFFHSNTVFLAK